MTYLLIVLMLGQAPYGFSVEFNSKEACEEARLGVQRIAAASNAICAPKGAPTVAMEPAERQESRATVARRPGRVRPQRRVTAAQALNRCIPGFNCEE